MFDFYIVESEVVTPEDLAFFTAMAVCDPGDLAIGGGFRTTEFGSAAPEILTSATFSGNDWTIEGRSRNESVGSLVAQARCADLTP